MAAEFPVDTPRRQQHIEELCIAAIRAIAGERDLHFRSRRLHRGRSALPLFAPHLHPSLAHDDFDSFRGAADGLALRLKHSDAARHALLRPGDPAERLVFDLLEQFRVESLAADAGLRGVVHNLRHRHEAWSLDFHGSGLADTARGGLLYTLVQMARARLSAEPVVEATEDFIEATRYALGPVIGSALAACKRERHDQAAFAPHALAIASDVGAMLRTTDTEVERGSTNQRAHDDAERAAFNLMTDLADLADLDAGEADEAAAAAGGPAKALADPDADAYRVFTRAYDQEHRAGSLLRAPVLAAHRERLDRRIEAQRVNLPRLVRELKTLLAVPDVQGWDGAQEEGRIDGSRLAQLVASPAERRVFRSERETPQADAVLTVLVDCSGSMRAQAENVAVLADLLARALEIAGARSEILGYSTAAWNGGRAYRDWVRAGRPKRPGRLNEALHLVFKDADTPWRRARRDIAGLLEPTYFREGIDGEAVQWACTRLRERDARQRLLLVVSDGCPMDRATELANDTRFLDHHLREVVAREQARGGVAIFGIGVGLDLSPYYPRSQAIEFGEAPGNEVFNELLRMLGGHRLR